MRRLRIIPLAVVVSLSASACLTEDAKCPGGHKKVRGLCVEVDVDTDAGHADSGSDDDVDAASDSGEDPGDDGGALVAPTECYLDRDHDGAGAGDEVDCDAPYADLPATDAAAIDEGATDAAANDGGAVATRAVPAVVHRNDDCDDSDPYRAPTLKELCDGIDNNCNSVVDDNAKNACGGTCTRVLDYAPGDACENGLQGACSRPGKYICQGETDVVCNAPQITASSELCADTIDNDCDGVVDEPDAVDASYWYQDCDGDGYAASTTGGVQSCTKPANAGSCGWTQVVPQPSTRTNWDCNDSSKAYKPGAGYGFPPAGQTSYDLNCDGLTLRDPAWEGAPKRLCNNTVLVVLNTSEACTYDQTSPLNGCYAWKTSGGQFTNTPPAASCPEAGTYEFVADNVLDPWTGGNTCYARVVNRAVIPCR
jgi:hypothetical protein